MTKELLDFIGYGPSAIGSSGGWDFTKDIYVRCRQCGVILHPFDTKENFGCACGRLFLDVDAGRFSAQDGDGSVEVYRKK